MDTTGVDDFEGIGQVPYTSRIARQDYRTDQKFADDLRIAGERSLEMIKSFACRVNDLFKTGLSDYSLDYTVLDDNKPCEGNLSYKADYLLTISDKNNRTVHVSIDWKCCTKNNMGVYHLKSGEIESSLLHKVPMVLLSRPSDCEDAKLRVFKFSDCESIQTRPKIETMKFMGSKGGWRLHEIDYSDWISWQTFWSLEPANGYFLKWKSLANYDFLNQMLKYLWSVAK